MPEPKASPRALSPPPLWPDTLPAPQADGFSVTGPPRVEVADVLFGVTRLAVKSRVAPMSWSFTVFLTREEFPKFEGWYRDVIENYDGEFYAPWIGGDRVVAFSTNYHLNPIGRGYALSATAIRTRIDHTVCDALISTWFENLYRADLAAVDIYQGDLASADEYVSNWDLELIAEHEC